MRNEGVLVFAGKIFGIVIKDVILKLAFVIDKVGYGVAVIFNLDFSILKGKSADNMVAFFKMIKLTQFVFKYELIFFGVACNAFFKGFRNCKSDEACVIIGNKIITVFLGGEIIVEIFFSFNEGNGICAFLKLACIAEFFCVAVLIPFNCAVCLRSKGCNRAFACSRQYENGS